MTRDPALKQAVDAWLEQALQAGRYEQALAAAARGDSEPSRRE